MTWTTLKEEAAIELPCLTLTGKVEYDAGQQEGLSVNLTGNEAA